MDWKKRARSHSHRRRRRYSRACPSGRHHPPGQVLESCQGSISGLLFCFFLFFVLFLVLGLFSSLSPSSQKLGNGGGKQLGVFFGRKEHCRGGQPSVKNVTQSLSRRYLDLQSRGL